MSVKLKAYQIKKHQYQLTVNYIFSNSTYR
jgi:hypothetical protein